MEKIALLIFAVAMLMISTSAGDPAADLKNSVLNIVGNGYGPGTTPIYSAVGGTLQPDGTLSFKTTIRSPGEPADEIVGTVKGRHIVFTRTRPGSFVQKYDGWFFEKPYKLFREMAGTFSHNGVNEYGWYGWLTIPSPK